MNKAVSFHMSLPNKASFPDAFFGRRDVLLGRKMRLSPHGGTPKRHATESPFRAQDEGTKQGTRQFKSFRFAVDAFIGVRSMYDRSVNITHPSGYLFRMLYAVLNEVTTS